MAHTKQLITKHRPTSFEEVMGNAKVVESLIQAIRRESRPHAFLFVGPSGVGKTTLARITAKELDAFVNEINAATHSGVDATRQIVEVSGFSSLMREKNKMYVIDECHNLSQKAWQPLLKLIEEPPEDFYLALCTTDSETVPDTIKTRCFPVTLLALTLSQMNTYVAKIAKWEGWTVQKDVLAAIARAAEGSPRMALSILE